MPLFEDLGEASRVSRFYHFVESDESGLFRTYRIHCCVEANGRPFIEGIEETHPASAPEPDMSRMIVALKKQIREKYQK